MRTTITLPDDLHHQVAGVARGNGETLSRALERLVRRGLGEASGFRWEVDAETGLPVITSGRTVDLDELRRREDDDLVEPRRPSASPT